MAETLIASGVLWGRLGLGQGSQQCAARPAKQGNDSCPDYVVPRTIGLRNSHRKWMQMSRQMRRRKATVTDFARGHFGETTRRRGMPPLAMIFSHFSFHS